MSTIGGLLLPKFDAPDLGRAMNQGILGGSQMVTGQTALLALQEEKRKQAAEAELMAAVQNDPVLRQQFFGGSILGGLGQPPPGPGGGPMTQQQVMPGQAHGAPLVVPGGQDLSRYAGVSPQGGGPLPAGVGMPTVTPPQSTLASLGPQPQGPMQTPRNPVLEMAQRDPRVAFLMQQQLQAREDQQFKMQEQRLKMGTAAVEHVGQLAQGITDQASLDAMRADLVSSGLGKYAAQLPQFYSKGAMEPFIAKAVAVKDSLTLQVQDLAAQAAMMKARREQANIPNYTGDAQLDALIYVKMKDQPPGTMPSREIIESAYQQREADKLRVQKAGVTPQIVEGEGGVKYAVDPHTLERRPIPGGPPGTATGSAGGGPVGGTAEPMRGPMSPDDKKIADYVSRMSDSQTKLKTLEDSGDYTSWKAPLSRMPGGRLTLSDKQQQYETAKGLFLQGILRRDSQGQISKQEWEDYSRDYFPQPGEGPEIVKQKQAMRDGAIRAQQAVLGRPGVPQAQPTSGGASGGQGGNTFTDADIAATLANPANKGKTRQQVIDAALAKGLTYKER